MAVEGQRGGYGAVWRYLLPVVQPLLDSKQGVSNIREAPHLLKFAATVALLWLRDLVV